jgi:hypothetical protein
VTNTDTANDKIARLIRSEAAFRVPCEVERLRRERRSDGVNELSRLRGSEGCEVRDDEVANL